MQQNIEIASAGAADLAAVQSFYSSVGYDGGLSASDRILVVRRAKSIIAAVRLSSECGTLVLRGMYVSESLRGAGIGSTLLAAVSEEIGPSACWCIPFARLERFYSRIGFSVNDCKETPEFLSARKKLYVSAGRDVIIMRRPAGWVSE